MCVKTPQPCCSRGPRIIAKPTRCKTDAWSLLFCVKIVRHFPPEPSSRRGGDRHFPSALASSTTLEASACVHKTTQHKSRLSDGIRETTQNEGGKLISREYGRAHCEKMPSRYGNVRVGTRRTNTTASNPRLRWRVPQIGQTTGVMDLSFIIFHGLHWRFNRRGSCDKSARFHGVKSENYQHQVLTREVQIKGSRVPKVRYAFCDQRLKLYCNKKTFKKKTCTEQKCPKLNVKEPTVLKTEHNAKTMAKQSQKFVQVSDTVSSSSSESSSLSITISSPKSPGSTSTWTPSKYSPSAFMHFIQRKGNM